MKRRFTLLLGSFLLSLASLTTAVAQTPLSDYTRAKTALETSVAAMPEDSVSSLDALRRAKTAFAPLGEELETPLRRGLQETFERAEQAIVNASQSDLKVQAAVLSGGFQRSLYEQALTAANDGDSAQARRLLGVLGKDLELEPAQFASTIGSTIGSNPAQIFQLTFERRLAARSLRQLEALRALPQNGRGPRYEVLAQLYSHVFLVQDSPRLPDTTQQTVLSAIQALIAKRPLAPTLTTLEGQLKLFQSASMVALTRLQTPRPVQQQPAPPKATPTDEPAAEPAATTSNQAATEPAPAATPPALEAETPPQPPTAAATTQPAAETTSAPQNDVFGLLSDPIRTYLRVAAGLLALVGVVSLFARAGTTPAQTIATALLLLPLLAEGLIALGSELAPLVGLPVLEQGERYSLFTNPLVQTVWLALGLIAGLCLLFARRAVSTRVGAPVSSGVSPAVSSVRPAPEAKPSTPVTPTRAPLSSAGGFDWDEDF